jgi:formylmethanofuran dehydrogenase subunit B
MSKATLDGKPITLEDACREAARILGGATFPVVAGLGADAAGARSAILLAEQTRGAFDHLASKEILADLDVLRSFSMFTTTPNEARVRADALLFVGPGLSQLWPAMLERLAPGQPPRHGAQAGQPRRIFWIGPEANEAANIPATIIPATRDELPEMLAMLRARVGGRPVAGDAARQPAIDELAGVLKNAHFGVVVWSASSGIDPLAIEMLQAMVADLNVTTRCTGVPIGARSGAAGVTQTSGWMTGFPPRTGFGRGYPEHDPWRFEAKRLVDSGEADAALWISAYSGEAPPWSKGDVPLITLAPAGKEPARGLYIEVGQPGVTHDCVEFAQEIGSFALRKATTPASAPSVAQIIDAIATKLQGEVSC